MRRLGPRAAWGRLVPLAVLVLALIAASGAAAGAVKPPPKKPVAKKPPATIAPARDGEIAFVSDRDGGDAIWATGPSGTNPVQLTHPDEDNGESDSAPAFSADGKTLAFIRENTDGGSDLWLAAANGAGAHKLATEISFASFSPDGKTLAVIVHTANEAGGLALIPSTGGKPRTICDSNVGSSNAPVFSSDGKQLAYSDSGRGIVIASLGATVNCGVALYGRIGADNPSYGADGSLAWDESHSTSGEGGIDIWIKRPGQPAKRIVATGDSNTNPVIAPALDRVVFTSDRSGDRTGLFTVALDGSAVRSLGDPLAGCPADSYCEGNSSPAWQPLR